MSKKKLSKVRLGKGLVIDAFRKAQSGKPTGTQAVFSILVGLSKPVSKKEIIARLSRSKIGKAAYDAHKLTRFYKEGDTLAAYLSRRVSKLIPYGLNPNDIPKPLILGNAKEGYSLTTEGAELLSADVEPEALPEAV